MGKENSSTNIGESLKGARLALDLSFVEISKEIGVTPQSISNFEKAVTEPRIIRYLIFLRDNGIDLNKLFDGDYKLKL